MTRLKECNARCRHVDPSSEWSHGVKLDEDAGRIHTDDCGFNRCTHRHDPANCCTSGKPGVLCRVRTVPRAAAKDGRR